jgi:hypothetical protein
MCAYKKLSGTLIFIVCLFPVITLNPSQESLNRLYGKIQILEETIVKEVHVPLSSLNIKIHRLREETQPDGQQIRIAGEIVKSTSPDHSGYFTFFDIDEGIYFIRVSTLNMVLKADLYLAEIRVKYNNRRYSLPTIDIKLEKGTPVNELGLRVKNTSKRVGDKKWAWRIFIEAPLDVIDSIECVEYHLHPTFRTHFWKICRDDKFNAKYPFSPPTFRGWGIFNVPVRILFRDGKICYLNHWLFFD